MLCKAEAAPGDKGPRWQAVSDGRATGRPVEIVAYFGDNIYDFPGLTQETVRLRRGAATAQQGKNDAALEQFGVKYFMLPNPMYGSWQ